MYGLTAFSSAQYAASRVYDRLFALHGWTDAQNRIREAARDHDHLDLVSVPWGLEPEEAEDATVAIVEGMR